MDADILVVGGGPVGLAVACRAAARGARCIVLERHSGWPVDKACGEGLMPPAVAWLERMGVKLAEAGPFAGIRYVDGGTVAEGRFPDGTGLGVRRTVISAALAARAQELGVRMLPGEEVLGIESTRDLVYARTARGSLRAPWLIGADGLHSRVRGHAGIAVTQGPPRFGLRRHFRVAAVPDMVEVHWHEAGEAYITPVGPDTVGVALLRGGEKQDYEKTLDRFPAVRAHLGEPVDAVRGAGPFARHVETPWAGRVLLVGDAAGYVDAITGEGLSIGWMGAEAVVDAALSGHPERWPRQARAISRRHRLFTNFLLQLARYPTLRGRVIRALARTPGAFSTMLGFNTGHHGLWRASTALLTIAGHLAVAGGRAPE